MGCGCQDQTVWPWGEGGGACLEGLVAPWTRSSFNQFGDFCLATLYLFHRKKKKKGRHFICAEHSSCSRNTCSFKCSFYFLNLQKLKKSDTEVMPVWLLWMAVVLRSMDCYISILSCLLLYFFWQDLSNTKKFEEYVGFVYVCMCGVIQFWYFYFFRWGGFPSNLSNGCVSQCCRLISTVGVSCI